jgi:hypothetical protein
VPLSSGATQSPAHSLVPLASERVAPRGLAQSMICFISAAAIRTHKAAPFPLRVGRRDARM